MPKIKSLPFKIAFASAALSMAVAGGCSHLPPSKPISELTPTELAGRKDFVLFCSRCHHATSTRGKKGPGLEGLFRRPYLRDGEVANDQRVTSIILNGHGRMPAMNGKMSAQQLKDLMAYLHTI